MRVVIFVVVWLFFWSAYEFFLSIESFGFLLLYIFAAVAISVAIAKVLPLPKGLDSSLKNKVQSGLMHIRFSVGALECKLIGHHDLMVDVVEFDDSDRFYPCGRCGRDAISGQSYKDWVKDVKAAREA